MTKQVKPLKIKKLSFKEKKKNLINFIYNSELFETLDDWKQDFNTTDRCKCGGSSPEEKLTDYEYSKFHKEYLQLKSMVKEL